MRNVSDKSCRENQNTLFVLSIFFFENLTVYEIMWKNIVDRGRPQMTIWRMCIACWITFFSPLPIHCNLCEDIRQSCLTVTINGMQEVHPVIYLRFLSSVTSDWRSTPHRWGFYITHSDALQSVGLLWTSGQLVAETSTWQHTTLTTDTDPWPQWVSNPRSQQASGRRPTP
jgi:hypothetical protein